ncbi:hypothetical protein VTN31DRAFT_1105 [Thermomyces dupontii]|uniref:uncharacterized protein n=1 Tax=Talaromyces thermophilus TaxID=28565 RepID=UPI003744324F
MVLMKTAAWAAMQTMGAEYLFDRHAWRPPMPITVQGYMLFSCHRPARVLQYFLTSQSEASKFNFAKWLPERISVILSDYFTRSGLVYTPCRLRIGYGDILASPNDDKFHQGPKRPNPSVQLKQSQSIKPLEQVEPGGKDEPCAVCSKGTANCPTSEQGSS